MKKLLSLSAVILVIIISIVFYEIKNYEPKLNHSLIVMGNIIPVTADELQKISKYKFYILLVDKDDVFPKKYSWPIEEVINEKIGGLIERADSSTSVFKEIFGSKNDKNKRIFSVVIITDKNAKIVGVYPNKKLSELVDVLQLHPDLIDLSLAGTAL